ncbi:MAG: cadherin-like domain-containing protein, partial [Actinomycetota bacterium]|nr:cadherin-like domain-containing protein [Actinomycetota bacterium]
PDGSLNPSSVTVTAPPEHGRATANTDGTVTYQAQPGYHRDVTFGYRVCDDLGACATATVTVAVHRDDQPPAPPR